MDCSAFGRSRILFSTLVLLMTSLPGFGSGSADDSAEFLAKISASQPVKVIQLPNSDLRVYLYQVESESGSARQFFSLRYENGLNTAPREINHSIRLRAGSFDPLGDHPLPQVRAEFQAQADGELFIVQFATQVLPEYCELVKQLGAEVEFFLPHNSHIVRMNAAVRERVAALPFVRWVGPFHPAYRLEEYLLDNWDYAAVRFPLQKVNIMVLRSGMDQKRAVAERITKLGGTVDREHAGKFLLEATLTPAQLLAVVHLDEVLFVDRWSPMEKDMNIAREIGGANYIESVEGFTGQGVRGEVIDAGFNLTHVDFASRPLILHTPVNSDSHGAATSGIVFGDGTGNALARGMLPDGQGIVADWDAVSVGTPRYDHTGELIQDPYFAVFQTASVGSARTTQYTTISVDTDAALFDFDIVHCQSQSNAGDRMSRPQAWAKNIISGGGIMHNNTLSRGDDCWCNGASIGPATDGRIKPDLSHFYDDTLTTSTGSTTAYTNGFGGTSGATPIICGHVGLVFQMWHEGVFGNTVNPNATVFENRPHATTVKALLINTAFQYSFNGLNHDLTRTHQGWGMPDLRSLYDLREKLLVVNEDEILPNLGSVTYNVAVLPGEPALKATLVFADPPGNPAASMHRINNLDLKVTAPSGTVYWGNNGLREGNFSTPNGVPNEVDTVENVFVENPESGLWSVEVIAAELNQDNHVETPGLDADFALVVTGGELGPGFAIAANPTLLNNCAPADAVFDLNITQIMGYSETVTLSASGAPAGTTISFTANPVVPPATTQMTISGMQNAALGQYSLQITGTAVDLVRATIVGLNVADAVPAQVVLTSPANGGVEISRMPTFAWDDAAQALDYQLELATDAGFTNVIFSDSLATTVRALPMTLESVTTYYWRVNATNGCGTGQTSAVFSFTTLDQPDYWTEQFSGGVDLDNLTLFFVPDGSGNFYDLCTEPASELPTDPSGGTTLPLTDDDFETVALAQSVSFFGVSYNALVVGSNGYVTFSAGDTQYTETLSNHFSLPRIAGLFDDLNPVQAGSVSVRELADRVAVTYAGVTEHNAGNANTFQIEVLHNGEVHVTYLAMAAGDGISGLSRGTGLPVDFIATDLSAAAVCNNCKGDLNGDQMVDGSDMSLCVASWGSGQANADLNGDGKVDTRDMIDLNNVFGPCP